MNDTKIARAIQEQIVAQCAAVQPELRDEPAAFKRACIRLGYEMALAIVDAKQVIAPKTGRAPMDIFSFLEGVYDDRKYVLDDPRDDATMSEI